MSFFFDLPNASRIIAVMSSKYVDDIVNNLKKTFQKNQQDESDLEAIMTQNEIEMYEEIESFKITFCGYTTPKKQKERIEYKPQKKMDYGNFVIIDLSEEQILSL
jgi:hypothetical protein